MHPVYLLPLLFGLCMSASLNRFPGRYMKHLAEHQPELISSLIKRNDEGCPAGFERIELYPDYCYMIVQEGYTWFEAHANCKIHGAEMLYIESEEESFILEAYVKSKEIDWAGTRLARMWLGLYKHGRGEWKWAKVDQPLGYTNWRSDANPQSFYHSCASLHSTELTWYNSFCNSNRSNPGRNGPNDSTWMYASMCKAPYQEPTE